MNELYLCELTDLKKDKFKKNWFDELKDEVGAVYDDNKIYVYSTVCPHFGGEFNYSSKNKFFKCKWHGWKFDVMSGKSITNFENYEKKTIFKSIFKSKSTIEIGCFPFNGQLKKYKHVIKNNKVFVINENSSI